MRISGFEALQQTYGLGAKVDTKVSYYVKETCYWCKRTFLKAANLLPTCSHVLIGM